MFAQSRHSTRLSLSLSFLFFLFLSFQIPQDVSGDSIPESIETPGEVSGRITDVSSSGIAGIQVAAYRFNVNSYPAWLETNLAISDVSGNYRIPLLQAGLYRIQFRDQAQKYADIYYPSTVAFEEAHSISVAGNKVGQINQQLQLGGIISGTINVPANMHLLYTEVSAYTVQDDHWQVYRGLTLPENILSFQVKGLPENTYRLCVHGVLTIPPHDLAECYEDITSGIEAATDIPIIPGAVINRIDFVLGDNGDLSQVSGLVKDTNGLPLEKISATLEVTPRVDLGTTYQVQTNSAGEYMFPAVLPGNYTLLLQDPNQRYAFEYFNDVSTFPEASTIPIKTRSRVELPDIQLSVGAMLTGHITIEGEIPTLSSVAAYRLEQGEFQYVYGYSPITSRGLYTVSALPSGVYKIQAYASMGNYYQDCCRGFYGGDTLERATPFTLTLGQVITDINFALENPILHNEISGTITTLGKPVEGIKVSLYQPDYGEGGIPEIAYTFSDKNGGYNIGAIPPNEYRLGFSDPKQQYATEFYSNFPILAYSDPIEITPTSTILNIDTQLEPVATIFGTIKINPTLRFTEVQVVAYWIEPIGSDQQAYSAYWSLVSSGQQFVLHGVLPGRYHICVLPPIGGFAIECYGENPEAVVNVLNAKPINVNQGATVGPIDITVGPDYVIFVPTILKE